jgi:hypothetical protein
METVKYEDGSGWTAWARWDDRAEERRQEYPYPARVVAWWAEPASGADGSAEYRESKRVLGDEWVLGLDEIHLSERWAPIALQLEVAAQVGVGR